MSDGSAIPDGEQLVLLRGGEMRTRIAGFDWARTPLGPAPAWPQSLRSAIEIMLCSRYPMLVWWGPELIQFYNDAYVPVLSQRHPWGLGQPAAICWAEAWPFVGALADAVMMQGVSTWSERLEMVMTRNGFPEEVYMTFSYSPILDEGGAIGGLFCACTEETGRVLGDRRLAALAALGDGTAPAQTIEEACEATTAVLAGLTRDLPFTLLYLIDAEGRTAQLVGRAGLAPEGTVGPSRVELGGIDEAWPFAAALARGGMVRVDDLAVAPGAPSSGFWPEPTRAAVVLPLQRSGGAGLAGFLVAGLSPRLPFDAGYRTFLDLLGRQIATALAAARAFEQERQRAEALAEIDRAKTAFFANVSHEFRTPLTLMLGPLEEALARAGLAPDVRERLEVVHRNGLRLLRLVNTLLDSSRVEAGRTAARMEPTDLAALTTDLTGVFRSACEDAGLDLQVACPPLGRLVAVDRDMWEKIVLNLLSNAFKFTLVGGIAVRMTREDDRAVLAVTDTGVGIPEAELPKVFDRFHRVEAARGRSHEGSGIGLALVRELVQLHDGTVEAESKLGQGATFTVRLPFGNATASDREPHPTAAITARAESFAAEARRWLPNAAPADEAGEDAAAPLVGTQEMAGARVLLVDDNADMRDYLRRMLASRFRVEAVADGAEALQRIEADPPDLVLSDVMMPRLDGFDLLRAIRTRPRLARLPVILLSARAGEESRVDGLDQGADDYLVKPFSARELVARVSTTLQMSQLRQRADEAVRASVALTGASTDVLYRMNPDWSEMRQLAGAGFLADTTEPDPDWLLAYIPEPDRPRVTAAIAAAVGSGTVFELEHRVVRADGGVGWTLSRAVPSRDAAGAVVEWFGSASDITARKDGEAKLRRNEAQLRAMVSELQHRTRNLLTIVSAVAEQTAAGSVDIPDFERRFNQRLAALGRVQGLLSREAAPDISLRALVALELAAHGAEHAVDLRGPEVVLPPAAVQLLALALHELTTNALKHGALRHGGTLAVSWVREGDGVRVLWTECDVPHTAEATAPGFGLQLIRWMLPYELDAETDLVFTPDGLRCSIRIAIEPD